LAKISKRPESPIKRPLEVKGDAGTKTTCLFSETMIRSASCHVYRTEGIEYKIKRQQYGII